MTDDRSQAMEEGRQAAAQGKPASANPYEAGSQESLDWLEGYAPGSDDEDDEDDET